MSLPKIAIVWFRRDLRLKDSAIISEATNLPEVLPCFVIDPWFYQQGTVSTARVKFLFESLENLDANLQKLGSRLYLFEGESVAIIQNLALKLLEQKRQPKLYFHQDVQVEYGINRDRQILNFYRQQNLETYVGLNHFLQPEENYQNLWQDYHDYQSQPLYSTPQQINTPQLNLNLPRLTITELKQKYRRFIEAETYRYLGGENNARGALNSFLSHRYQGYHWKMSRPWLAQQGATSHLSPHLDFGTVSSRVVYQDAMAIAKQLPPKSKGKFALKTFLDRLRWHDKFLSTGQKL